VNYTYSFGPLLVGYPALDSVRNTYSSVATKRSCCRGAGD
jgi:hypothetical protein